MDQQQFQMFSLLIHTIAKMMTSSEVQRVKRELEGHISKEGLARIKNGKSLMILITDCGFFNENKLMFFKKILNKSRLHEAEGILSEYIARRKISNEALNHGKSRLSSLLCLLCENLRMMRLTVKDELNHANEVNFQTVSDEHTCGTYSIRCSTETVQRAQGFLGKRIL